MRRGEIQVLLDYDLWATGRLLEMAALLTDQQFLRPAGPGHAPIQSTLVHLLTARMWWRLIWQGEANATALTNAARARDLATAVAVRALLEEERDATLTALATTPESRLSESIPARLGERSISMAGWQMLAHAMNHGTQHRGEIAQALTLLGHSPGDFDLDDFLTRPDTPLPSR